MLTLLIIFISICIAGAAFWFYNRKQITSLVENIDDKQAVISALQSHVDSLHTPSSEDKPKKKGPDQNKSKRPYNKGNKSNTPSFDKNNNPKPRKNKTQK